MQMFRRTKFMIKLNNNVGVLNRWKILKLNTRKLNYKTLLKILKNKKKFS